jgi:hypothetical protein
MQFAGKKGIAVFVLLISGAVVIGFGSGLFVGRQFPAHRYERFGNSPYLLDSATGKVCDPRPDTRSYSEQYWDKALGPVLPAPYPPPCGK